MIIPIGHDEQGVKRLPWVTFGIIGLCIVVFLFTKPSGSLGSDGSDDLFESLDYYFEHPYLELPSPFDRLLGGDVMSEELLEATRSTHPPPEDAEQRAREQRELEALCQKALAAIGADTFFAWGLIPADISLPSLITHMFLHGGWFHLLGNLLFLYLAGPFIEDVWGRPIYAGFYLVAGIVAALAHILRAPDSMIPMIGASGAIAGVMGAFLIRYRHTPIRFFYIFGLLLRGTFKAPAWIMLPLWFLQQVFFAMLTHSSGPEGGGVAYWAHIGGFVFGAGIALGMQHFRIEQRFVAAAIEAKVDSTLVNNEAVDAALESHARGDTAQAIAGLEQAVAADPADEAAVTALWSLAASEARHRDRATGAMLGLIQTELRYGQGELALSHWNELTRVVPHPPADAELLVRMAQLLSRNGSRDEAMLILRRAMLEGGSGMTPSLAMSIARTARHIDPQLARGAARLLLIQPALDPTEREFAERLLAELEGPPVSPA